MTLASTVNIVFPAPTLAPLVTAIRSSDGAAEGPVENVVFALAEPFTVGQRTMLRVQDLLTFTPAEYAVREAYAVQLRPEALARVVAAVSRRRLVPIKVHRHVCDRQHTLAYFSPSDDAADRELARLFRDTGFASVLMADEPGGGYTVLARHATPEGALTPAAVIELRLPLRVHGSGSRADLESPRLARARLEFGAGVINTLSDLRAGVIGTGGLGWRSAAALADSGIGSLLLFDFDKVEERNVLRLEAATDEDLGLEKVIALRRYLARRHGGLEVIDFNVDVIDTLDRQGPARDALVTALGSCDVLLLVTDNHPSRLSILTEAERLQVPYVHCGMHQLTSQDMYARLSVHVPGVTACAVCASNVDRAQGSRRGPGYIRGVDLPNVAAWNVTAAGHVANAVRMLAVPLGPERLRDLHAWEIGLSWPGVRVMPVGRRADCQVCA